MAEPIPLAPEDRAILGLECETIAGHTCKVILLGEGAPDADAVRERIGERIGAAPELRYVLGGTDEQPTWEPRAEIDLGAQVVGGAEEPLDADALRDRVAGLFAERLDRTRPLWRIDVVPRQGGGQALIWRLHHALADGTAAIRFAKAVLWDEVTSLAETARPTHVAAGAAADDARRRTHLARFLEHELGESLRRSPFDGKVGTRRRIDFAVAPLAALHDAAKSLCGATLNDAVLAIVAGALRRWVIHHHGSLGSVRVRIPVSLHHEGDTAGNRDSFFSIPLPLNEPDPVERLRVVHEATTVRKTDQDADRMDALLGDLGSVSPRLRSFAERIEANPRRFALNVSNVPGPRDPVSVLGAPVEALHSIAEIGERHALRMTAVSLAGTLYFGLCADPGLVDDLGEMATGIEAGAAELIAAAG